MKSVFLSLTFLLLFASCSNNGQKKRDLPRYISNKGRTCDGIEADTFSTIAALEKDFYTTALYKDSFELFLHYGAFYYYHRDYDSSLYYYNLAKTIDSSDSKLFFNIGLAYTESGQLNDALRSINKSISLCGPSWETLNSKCYILWKLGRPQEGIEPGEASLHLNPDNKKIYGNLLHCFDALGQRDSVLKYIDIVEKKRTTLPDWYRDLKAKYDK